MRTSVFVFIPLLLLASCVVKPSEKSAPLITNGVPTDAYPGVVQLDTSGAVCTATFVAEDLVLTAAHCIKAQQFQENLFFTQQMKLSGLNGLSSYRALKHPEYDLFFPQKRYLTDAWSMDLGLVAFPPASAPFIHRLSQTPVKKGDRVFMVGYGFNQRDGVDRSTNRGAMIKRIGSNIVQDVRGGFIFIEGLNSSSELGQMEPTGVDSAILQGDSGGPLFNEAGEIVGVSASTELDPATKRLKSIFVATTSIEAIGFLAQRPSYRYVPNDLLVGTYQSSCIFYPEDNTSRVQTLEFDLNVATSVIKTFRGQNCLDLTQLLSIHTEISTLAKIMLADQSDYILRLEHKIIPKGLLVQILAESELPKAQILCPGINLGINVPNWCPSLGGQVISRLYKVEGNTLRENVSPDSNRFGWSAYPLIKQNSRFTSP